MSTDTTARPADALREGDTPAEAPPSGAAKRIGGVAGWVDDRTGAAKPVGYLMKKVFPDHWSFMLGEIAMYSMIICLLTGAFLTFWFVPSAGHIVYDGSFVPLRGVSMSEAYASTLNISFDIKGGLIIRQIHHWAALMFIVALVGAHVPGVLHRRLPQAPRDQLGHRHACSRSWPSSRASPATPSPTTCSPAPACAPWPASCRPPRSSAPTSSSRSSAGPFPGEMIIPRLYSAHVLLIPAILIGLFTAHIGLVFVQKHTQFPGPGRTNENVVGYPVMPVYAAKAGGFFFIVFGVIALISALVQINPIWGYGPYDPSAGDRRRPARLVHGLRRRRAAPAAGLAGVRGLRVHPVAEHRAWVPWCCCRWSTRCSASTRSSRRWVTGDKREHHLLDRPAQRPGAHRHRHGRHHRLLACFCFAAGNDIMAIKLGLSINDITWFFRIGLFVLPPIAFWVTKRICLSLQRRDRDTVLHGRETGTIVRTPDGKFFERHERRGRRPSSGCWCSTRPSPRSRSRPSVDENGVARKAHRKDRRRAWFSRFYFADAVNPVTPAELAAAHHHGAEHEAIEPSASGGARPIESAEAAEIESGEPAGRH